MTDLLTNDPSTSTPTVLYMPNNNRRPACRMSDIGRVIIPPNTKDIPLEEMLAKPPVPFVTEALRELIQSFPNERVDLVSRVLTEERKKDMVEYLYHWRILHNSGLVPENATRDDIERIVHWCKTWKQKAPILYNLGTDMVADDEADVLLAVAEHYQAEFERDRRLYDEETGHIRRSPEELRMYAIYHTPEDMGRLDATIRLIRETTRVRSISLLPGTTAWQTIRDTEKKLFQRR